MTKDERLVWYMILKQRPLWYKRLRQKLIWSFILDFYCSELLLCIEVDGKYHEDEETQEYDEARTIYLHNQWIVVLRYTNEQVATYLESVKTDIHTKIKERSSQV